jgi:hypothetical protein
VFPFDALVGRDAARREPFLGFPYCLRVAHPERLAKARKGAR